MKKVLLAALAASFATTAFAQKHMIQFYGWDEGARDRSFDLSTTSDDADNETSTTNVALNYAYAISPSFQLGATYRSLTGEIAGTDVERVTLGLDLFWNVNNRLSNTHVVGLRYWVTDWGEPDQDTSSGINEDDKQSDIILEYGYRWKIGSLANLDITYAPRVSYTFTTFEPDASSSDDIKTNALAWDFLKFDMIF